LPRFPAGRFLCPA